MHATVRHNDDAGLNYVIFISYARSASAATASALHEKLTRKLPLPVFLDTSDIEAGDRFPQVLVDALLRSKIIVVFVEGLYFRRWYCLRELRTALAPLDILFRRNTGAVQTASALEHIVLALPAGGARPEEMDNLPPELSRLQSWPRSDQAEELERVVRKRYAATTQTLAERIGEREVPALTRSFLSEAVLPEPVIVSDESSGGPVPRYAQALPPSLGEKFVGRANDLWRIHFALSTLHHFLSNKGGTVSVEGGAGFGKSRLALEYFLRFGPRHYAGGNFWVDASERESLLTAQFQGILQALQPSKKLMPTIPVPEQTRDALREALHLRTQSTPVLFVIDNIPEAGDPKPLEHWCPGAGEVSCLITSRRKVSWWSTAITSLPLDTIDTNSALALLTDGLDQRDLSDAEWRKVAEMTGNLPLALELLNRALRVPGVSARKVSARLQKSPIAELHQRYAVLRPHVPKDSLRGVTEAFEISYRTLGPSEKKAARLLAQLAPDPIPLRVLELMRPKGMPESVQTTLVARSFVSAVRSAEIEMFGSMHRLLGEFLRSRSKTQQQEQLTAATAIVDAMAESASEDPREWPLIDACVPHANQFFDQFSSQESREDIAVRVGARLGAALIVRGATHQAQQILEASGSWAAGLLGAKNDLTLELRVNLASALKAEGEYQKAELIERSVLESLIEGGDTDSRQYLTALNNLGVTLGQMGKLRECLKVRQQHFEVCIHKGMPIEVLLMSANNLAEGYSRMGDFPTAAKFQTFTLRESTEKLGPNHPETLISKNNLAGSLAHTDPERAIVLLREVIETGKQTIGAAHPRTLRSTITLANLLGQRGEEEEAIQLLDQALETSRAKWGDEDLMTLTLMSDLGLALGRIATTER